LNHIVEPWEMVQGERAVCVPACLVCGWTGEKGTRLTAEREGSVHEEGGTSPQIVRKAPLDQTPHTAIVDRIRRC
jgi:hypothetical protein